MGSGGLTQPILSQVWSKTWYPDRMTLVALADDNAKYCTTRRVLLRCRLSACVYVGTGTNPILHP